MKLLQQQMHPDARAVDALRKQLRWQYSGKCFCRNFTAARAAIAFAFDHSAIDDRLNFFEVDLDSPTLTVILNDLLNCFIGINR